MSDHTALRDAARDHAAAYAAHCSERDLAKALRLYKKIMASYASAPEAGYSRTQVQNIAHAVVPEQELLDARMELAVAHLEDQISPGAEPIPVAPLASERAE